MALACDGDISGPSLKVGSWPSLYHSLMCYITQMHISMCTCNIHCTVEPQLSEQFETTGILINEELG